jgi:hypothetical protein
MDEGTRSVITYSIIEHSRDNKYFLRARLMKIHALPTPASVDLDELGHCTII